MLKLKGEGAPAPVQTFEPKTVLESGSRQDGHLSGSGKCIEELPDLAPPRRDTYFAECKDIICAQVEEFCATDEHEYNRLRAEIRAALPDAVSLILNGEEGEVMVRQALTECLRIEDRINTRRRMAALIRSL
jgi:hypothetical protein